jgi:alkanesulfonate monooxygenase SsuD/methylene tetrahydromethanopterin reductase-like flavin-dependent oxidoreductase (luciferase family)
VTPPDPPAPGGGSLLLGIALGGAGDAPGWRERLELAAFAEALGLHSVWLPEGHFGPGATASPLVALAAIAARTRRLRLGTTSLLLPIHHPLRIATEVSVLDALSGGRVWLGLGRGFREPVFQGFGVASRTKRDRFDEALDAILEAWSGNAFRLAGRHFAALGADDAVRPAPRPVQRPHPPLLVAAFGPKGLVQAARRGLAYLASPLETLEVLEENFALHRANLPPGAELAPVRVPVLRTVHVAADDAEARRALDGLAREFPGRRGEAGGVLARAAGGRLEDRVLVGTERAVADGIARYRERLGLDLLVARVQIPGIGDRETRASLERLATRIVASFDAAP